MVELLATTLFIGGYAVIAFEHRFFVNKAATSLLLAVLLWVIASMHISLEVLTHHITSASADLFGLVVFLITSMTLVEILLHYRFFDVIERYLRSSGWDRYYLGWAIMCLTFIFSMFVPNFTATIVAIQIARRFFPTKELIPIAALMVIAANAGGAFSPIGDVVTLLLWFAGKFQSLELLAQGVLPAVVLTIVSGWFLLRNVQREQATAYENGTTWEKPSRSEWSIIIAALTSFFLPLAASALGLPPYLGLLAGLGGVWLLIDVARHIRPMKSHLKANIHHFLRQADIESIQFFIGILLSVGALHALGLLDIATQWLLGSDPSFIKLVSAFTGLGITSALVDNVPLAAAAISSVQDVSSAFWILLSISVGTGGSLLVIGAAAGIVAMGMVPELNFGTYMKTATLPALVGFAAGILTWVVQYQILY
ncbi:MAG: SLC13 family permease [Patescibacteria group bacterium]